MICEGKWIISHLYPYLFFLISYILPILEEVDEDKVTSRGRDTITLNTNTIQMMG